MSATLTALMTEVQARITAATTSTPNTDLVNLAVTSAGLGLNTSNLTTVLNTKIAAVNSATALTDILLLKKAAMVNSETVIGQTLQGHFEYDSRYLLCDGKTHLVSSYPDIPTTLSTALGTQLEPSVTNTPTRFPLTTVDARLSFDGTTYWLYSNIVSPANIAGPYNFYKSTDLITWTQISIITNASSVQYAWQTTNYGDMVTIGATRIIPALLSVNSVNSVGAFTSFDSGTTWHFETISTIAPAGGNAHPKIVAIGNTLVMAVCGDSANSTPWYSIDAGVTWQACTAAAVIGHNPYSLGTNGSRFVIVFSDGSTAYSTAADPSGSNWTAVAQATTLITWTGTPLETMQASSKVIITSTGNSVYTSTDCIAWTKQTTLNTGLVAIGNTSRVVLAGTRLFFMQTVTGGSVLSYADNATTFAAPTSVVTDSKLPILNFFINLNSDGTNIYANWNTTYMYKSSTGASGSWTVIGYPYWGSVTGQQYQCCMIKKYGVLLFSASSSTISGSSISQGTTMRHISTDNGVTWAPCVSTIAVGPGTIIDCNTRLLAMDSSQLLWQSTDGVTWNTTGLTRPTVPGTNANPLYGRMYRVNTGTYMLVCRDNNTTWYWYFSSDNGSTWNPCSVQYGTDHYYGSTSVSPLTYWNGNYYFAWYQYVSGSPNVYNLFLYKSSNGYTWSLMANGNMNGSGTDTINQYGAHLIVHDTTLYAWVGTVMGSSPYAPTSVMVSYDGSDATLMASGRCDLTLPATVLAMMNTVNNSTFIPRYDYGTPTNFYTYTNGSFYYYRAGNNNTTVKMLGPTANIALLIDGSNYRFFGNGTEKVIPNTNVTFTMPNYTSVPLFFMRSAL